jgi:hypothetical protein
MIPIIPDFVHEFAYLPNLRLNPRQRRHLEQHLLSLMVCGEHRLFAQDDPGLDPQVSVVELISEDYPWNDKMIEDERGRLIQETTRKCGIDSGVLILEPLMEPDLLPEGQSAGVENKPLVLSHFACEAFHVPLDFETFRGLGKRPDGDAGEKTSALKALFAKALQRDLPLSMVWMDAWFFCSESVEFLEKNYRFPYVAAVDGKFQVLINNQVRTLFQYAADLPRDAYKLEKLTTDPKSRSVYRYVSRVVDLAPVGQVRLVIAYDLMRPQEPIFLATNQFYWSIEKILWKYNWPWFVEHLWRDSLNPLDIGRGGLESALGMEWQVRMSFLAETLFQLNTQRTPLYQPEWASKEPHENKTPSSKTPRVPLFKE